jgi:hypothetical protein
MAKPREGVRNPKPQDEKKHPNEWEEDLNPDRLEGQNIGGQRVDEITSRTAAHLREFAEVLSDFRRDELAQIPIVPTGMRLKQGAVYLDLNNPAAGPIKATGELIAGAGNLYAPKAEIPYEYWNRLLSVFALEEASNLNERQPGSEGRSEISEDLIDKTLADSFPSSDPPSWNMGREANPLPQTRESQKIPLELTEESRDLLVSHFKEGTELHQILDHAARNEVGGIAVYAFECDPPEAEALLEMARDHCPPAVKDIEHAIVAARRPN